MTACLSNRAGCLEPRQPCELLRLKTNPLHPLVPLHGLALDRRSELRRCLRLPGKAHRGDAALHRLLIKNIVESLTELGDNVIRRVRGHK